MRKSILAILTLSVCLSLTVVARAAGRPTSACPADVTNLSVSILNDNPIYAILPDAAAPYKNGGTKQNKITSMFQRANCSFDFTLNLNYSTRYITVNIPGMPTTAKFFNSDRVASVPLTDGGVAFKSWCDGGVQRNADGSIKKNADGNYQDVYAPCGEDKDADGNVIGYFARRNIGFDLAGDYNLRFQNSPVDGISQAANNTALIKVYHYAATATSRERWVLTPDRDYYTFTDYTTPAGFSTDTTNTPELQTRAAFLFGGVAQNWFSMPFRMEVTTF